MSLEKSIVSPLLVGRADQVAALDRLIARTGAGHHALALIDGEAGIGKSRLVAETRRQAAALDWFCLQGNCFENDSALPFAALIDLVRSFSAQQTPAGLERFFGPTAADLVKLVPELAGGLPGLVPSPHLEPQQEKYCLFEALGQFFARLAAVRPVLLVLEDLHWSDETGLECLLRLARRFAAQPILVVLTYRTDEVNAALGHFLAELDRGRLATELVLNRLSLHEVEAMLAAIFGLDHPPRTAFVQAIYAQSEGNPFYIEEILKSLLVAGEIGYADGAWDRWPAQAIDIPRSVQDAVRRRVQWISPPAQQVLTLAAVAGKVVNYSLLETLSGMSEAALTAAMKELVAAQLLVEESADQFAFRHALTRAAVYSTLLKRERQRVHRLIAETLEQADAQPSEVPLASLSYHFFEGAQWAKALEYARRAGEQALALFAPREAIEHLTRACAAARQLAIPVSPSLYRARGQAYETVGDFAAALADSEAALNGAHAAQDGAAEWQSLIELGILWAGRDYARSGDYFQRAIDLAVALGDARLHARSLNRRANWCVNLGRNLEGLAMHRQALAIFERQADGPGMADTLDLLGMASWQLGDEVASHRDYVRAIELFRALNDKRGLASALVGGSHSFYWDETVRVPLLVVEENRCGFAEALDLARQIGWMAGQAFGEWSAAMDLADAGAWEPALAHAREAQRCAAEIGHRQWIIAAHYTLGHIHRLMLQPALAVQNLEAALPLARELGSPWWIGNITTDLALAHVLGHQFERARAALDAALDPARDPRNVAERRMLWARGRLLLAQGQAGEALRIAGALLDSAPGDERAQPIPDLLALQGEALLALAQADAAERVLRAAEQGAIQRSKRPLLWQIHRLRGRVYQQLKRRDEAEQAFASARGMVHTLAQTIDDAGLRDDFTRAALATLPKEKPAAPRRAEAQKFGGLTAREREVARLIALGKSNREIAGELVLSERTVENYVGNMLAKLDFDSRAQIAVWAVRAGLGSG